MGGFSVFMTLLLGIKFIVRPVMTTKESSAHKSRGRRIAESLAAAAWWASSAALSALAAA